MFEWAFDVRASLIVDRVLLGDRDDSRQRDVLVQHNVGAVISLLDDAERTHAEKMLYKELGIELFHFQLKDEEKAPIQDYLECVNQLIVQFSNPERLKSTVLVHCKAGISRSAAMVIYHLMRSRGYTLKDAIAHVKAKRRIISPNDGFMSALYDADLARKLHSLN